MRILELHLDAFGPFTEKHLDLAPPEADGAAREEAGLCVIHGANEAGKSSALRAIHDLLYGIPPRSRDDFVHRYADLRVGARLRFADGEELSFVRRKGSKDTVRCEDGDSARSLGRLDEIVRIVPESVFRDFYGLDHERLSHGSQALLDDDGELGRTLYAAGLGSGNLRALLSALESEAEGLFTPRGKLPQINAALASLKALQTRIKQESLRPRAWKEAKTAEQQAYARLEALETAHEEQRVRLTRLQRVQRTLPALARRRHWLAKHAALPRLPELGLDFEARLRELRSRRRLAGEALDAAREKQSRLEARLAALAVAPALLTSEETIRGLQAGWGAVAKDLEDLPRRESDLGRLEREIASRWTAIDPGGSLQRSGRLSELLGRSRRLRDLAGQWQALEEAAANDRERCTAASERLEAVERAVSEEPEEIDPSWLRRAIQAAEMLGDIDGRIGERERILDGLEDAYEQGHASLGDGLPPAEQLEHAWVPEADALEQAAAIRSGLDRRAERLRESEQTRATERRSVAEELARLRAERAVPSETDLEIRRREREALWRRVRQAWESGVAPADAPLRSSPGIPDDPDDPDVSDAGSLPDAYQTSVARADETADRLRVDADRVAREAALRARQDRLDEEQRSAHEEHARLDAERAAHERDWRASWSAVGIVPGPPLERIAWRRRFERWLDLARERRAAREQAAREQEARREALEALRQALAAMPEWVRSGPESVRIIPEEALEQDLASRIGSRLAPLLALARAAQDRIDAASVSRSRLAESRAAAQQERDEAERALRRSTSRVEQWRLDWGAAIQGLGFETLPQTGEALDRLEALREVVEIAASRDQIADRIAKMRRDIARFEAELEALVRQVAQDLAAGDPSAEQLVRRLQERLETARTAEARRQDLVEEIAETTQQIETAERTLRAMAEQLAELCAEAGVSQESALDPILQAWQEQREIGKELERAEQVLMESGDGLKIEALAAEAEREDPDTLPGRIADLEAEIAQRTKQGHALRAEIVSARETLQRMDGSAEMAELAATVEQERAAIRRQVERYAVLRLAREILMREIERYRREHQAPVLSRATGLFERLTRGAYPLLDVDYDEDGKAQLVALARSGTGREGSRRIRVDEMSSGTRDQLFLALRLATMEESLERAEPMPLIADDILVHFDDDRSQATLEVLADLGARVQILLFTHHARIRDQARALGPRARVIELDGEPPTIPIG